MAQLSLVAGEFEDMLTHTQAILNHNPNAHLIILAPYYLWSMKFRKKLNAVEWRIHHVNSLEDLYQLSPPVKGKVWAAEVFVARDMPFPDGYNELYQTLRAELRNANIHLASVCLP